MTPDFLAWLKEHTTFSHTWELYHTPEFQYVLSYLTSACLWLNEHVTITLVGAVDCGSVNTHLEHVLIVKHGKIYVVECIRPCDQPLGVMGSLSLTDKGTLTGRVQPASGWNCGFYPGHNGTLQFGISITIS